MIERVVIGTRLDCCFDRYAGVSIFLDGEKIATKPANFRPFKNQMIFAIPAGMEAKEIKIDWPLDKDYPAHVSTVEVTYDENCEFFINHFNFIILFPHCRYLRFLIIQS